MWRTRRSGVCERAQDMSLRGFARSISILGWGRAGYQDFILLLGKLGLDFPKKALARGFKLTLEDANFTPSSVFDALIIFLSFASGGR